MIYTVTFSPAVDYVVFLDKLKAGETNRFPPCLKNWA